MSTTDSLVRFIIDTKFESLPKSTIDHAKLCIKDTLGCALYGTKTPWAKTVLAVLKGFGGKEEASVWGTDVRLPSHHAAFVNGVASNAFEIDDTHIKGGGVHPGSVILPAVIAMSEREKGISGRHLIEAVVVGYESLIRISAALGNEHATRGFYTSSTAGAIGAAAASSKILRLDKDKTKNALYLAANRAAGLYSASVAKRLNMGTASMNGVLSALLAKSGVTGIDDALEAEFGGFLNTFNPNYHVDEIRKGLGAKFELNNVGFKFYSCSRSNHTTLDALKSLIDKYDINSGEITKVYLRTTTLTKKYGVGFDVTSVPQALMSLPYCAAVMLVYRRAFVNEFTEEKIRNQRVRKMMERISVKVDKGYDELGPRYRWKVRAELRLSGGKIVSATVDHPRGSAENPAAKDELDAKFNSLTSEITQIKREDMRILVENLDKANVQELGNLLVR